MFQKFTLIFGWHAALFLAKIFATFGYITKLNPQKKKKKQTNKQTNIASSKATKK
jgi:hypothetical protein